MAKTSGAGKSKRGKSMTKSEVASAIAGKVGLTKKQVLAVLEAQAELAYAQARETFVVPGIGKLVLTDSPARKILMQFGRDAGKLRDIPARKRLTFRVAKAAKDAVLGAGRKK